MNSSTSYGAEPTPRSARFNELQKKIQVASCAANEIPNLIRIVQDYCEEAMPLNSNDCEPDVWIAALKATSLLSAMITLAELLEKHIDSIEEYVVNIEADI